MQTAGQPGGKTLILRPRLFEVTVAPVALSADDPRLVAAGGSGAGGVIECVPPWNGAAHASGAVYELVDGHLARLPAPAVAPFAKADMSHAVLEALNGNGNGNGRLLAADVTSAEVELALVAMRHLTAGGLKSLMQKAVRFHAKQVELAQGLQCSAALVAAACAALLFADKGTFSPELQLFTRGGTAAFKRIAVIVLEDAWPEEVAGAVGQHGGTSTSTAVCALTTLALAMQRMHRYEPPREAIVAALRLVARAALSPTILAWRTEDTSQAQVSLSCTSQAALGRAAFLMRAVRSFESDMAMFETVAKLSSRGSLPVRRTVEAPALMPYCHMVDHHCYRGIAHTLNGGGATFASRFSTLFNTVTGSNPRRTVTKGFESRPAVQRARFAQRCVLRFVMRSPRAVLPPPQCLSSAEVVVSLQLDPGVLAAAVGPIKLKIKEGGSSRRVREVVVMLGVSTPEDEIVMLPPARATRDLFGSLSDAERSEAIACLRARPSLPAKSPLLPPGGHAATFLHGCWCLDGEPWADVVARGSELSVPLVIPPAWAAGGALDLTKPLPADDDALADALSVMGTGCVPRAKQLVIALFASVPATVALRAASMLRQQWQTVAMPTPALSGGLGSDQLAAYNGDWDAYRLLVLLSRLVPGALRPAMPPTFIIPEARLLRVAERWAMVGARMSGGLAADNEIEAADAGPADGTVPSPCSGEETAADASPPPPPPPLHANALVSSLKEAMGSTLSAEVEVLHLLRELGRVDMTIELLKESGAGRVVHDLKKDRGASEAVRGCASALVDRWKASVAAEKATSVAALGGADRIDGTGIDGTGSTGGARGDKTVRDDDQTASDITWETHPKWSSCGKRAAARLMEHQQVAVARMHRRDETADGCGHFLILDTGLGKTVTSLVYAYRWLCKYGGAVRRIIWVTPAGTVDNLLEQLKKTWGAPVWNVPRVSSAKTLKSGELTHLQLVDFAVNVIHADHLRSAIDQGLTEQATSSFLIFDEVDDMYAPTLRTSAARSLAGLAPKFVAQTATPMRRNESQVKGEGEGRG
uniref:TFIIS N-terminal domain-containing protein n=1 Tax=Haptolina brevifila TaxID=156173 RepID=A0A7S2DLB5_9EUKA